MMYREKKPFFKRALSLFSPARRGDEDFADGEEYCEEDTDAQEAGDEAGSWMSRENSEAQLTIDMCQTPTEIIIQTIVAGVRPEDLDISINRDIVTVRGERESAHKTDEADYFHEELYWGGFSRTILLPQEIDIDAAAASVQNGLLTIRLPKLDKNRTHRLEIEAEE